MAKTQGSGCVLFRLSFASRVAAALPGAVLARIERQARDFNLVNGLTGELHLLNGGFRQSVEGPAAIVLPLAARIFADQRHCEIEIGSVGPVSRRRFRTWRTYGFEDITELSRTCSIDLSNVTALVPRRERAATRPDGRPSSALVLHF